MAERAERRKGQEVRLSLAKALEIAAHHQKVGEVNKAADIYRQILKRNPDNADALHLLGVLSHQAGKPERAVELIKRAIAAAPPNESFHNNLGEVYRAAGRFREEVAEYRRALAPNPDSHETQKNLGAVLRQMGRWARPSTSRWTRTRS